MVSRLKERLSSNKESDKKEQTTGETNEDKENKKEQTVERTSEADLAFYNKYIEVANKVTDVADGMHKEYMNGVPDPKTLRKNSLVLALMFDFKVTDMERLLKEYKRSLLDGGELSKLSSENPDMKKEVEGDFKDLLDVMDSYYTTAKRVSDYYRTKEYQNDLSKAAEYDDEMKSRYERYKSSSEKFNDALKKYKPLRKKRDVNVSNPDEKAVNTLMNTYENTLDNAESFFGSFQKIEKNSGTETLQSKLDDFEKNFNSDKRDVESAPFTDKSKYMKYNFEDYFVKQVENFISETRKFLGNAAKMKESDFNKGYDNVVTYYNYMITAYNTSINTVNTFRVY